MATAVSAVCALTACVYDDLPDEPDVDRANSFLNIELAVPLADTAPAAPANGYQDGDAYENYIDISKGNYRIYFFDDKNTLIAQFYPAGFNAVDGADYREYSIFGITPQQLAGQKTFKVMVLANWPSYPPVTPGVTTVDAICKSDLSRFNCLTDFRLNPEEGRLIPLYGIHRYDNVSFTKGERTTLSEPITMLRAMAKVEVILNAEQNVTFTDVTLHRHNALGFCAPEKVYSQTDYGQGLDWTGDYLHRLHLVGGKNDAEAVDRELPFRRVNGKENGKKETWIAYIPEYRNAADDNGTAAADEAYIDVRLSNRSDEKPFHIYFADYGDNGGTSSTDLKRMNIERNNIYRFTISMSDNGMGMEIFVRQWNLRPQPPIIL